MKKAKTGLKTQVKNTFLPVTKNKKKEQNLTGKIT